MRRDPKKFKTFLRNLSANFIEEFRGIVDRATAEEGGERDRRLVLTEYSKLLARHCQGTSTTDWIFIAGLVLANVDELYEGNPLGKATRSNVPVGYGSKDGVKNLQPEKREKNTAKTANPKKG